MSLFYLNISQILQRACGRRRTPCEKTIGIPLSLKAHPWTPGSRGALIKRKGGSGDEDDREEVAGSGTPGGRTEEHFRQRGFFREGKRHPLYCHELQLHGRRGWLILLIFEK